MPESRVIDTADALRMLPYHSPLPGWHAHGSTLIPTDSCHACNYLKRQQAYTAASSLIRDEAPADPEVSGGDEVAGLSQPE